MTSSRISTIARAVVYPRSEEKLIQLISRLSDIDANYIVLGRMSNILVKDGKYDGIIIKTTGVDGNCIVENEITFSCGSGIVKTIKQMAQKNLGGMEGLVGIPGTIGGLVKQNAGAFGYETSDRFKCATCYMPNTRSICNFTKEDMDFSYRDSKLCHTNAILLNATFELLEKNYNDIIGEMSNYKFQRSQMQPLKEPSLGSVFKRYNGISAGYYIDMAGLKGHYIGDACVSTKHAGFIVNKGGATATDYFKLIEYVKEKVYSVFKIELEEEIEII